MQTIQGCTIARRHTSLVFLLGLVSCTDEFEADLELADTSQALATSTPTHWDPAQTGTAYTTLAADLLTIKKDDYPSNTIYSTTAAFANKTFSTGKWYFEERVLWMAGGTRQRVGIASTTGRQLNGPGSADDSIGMDYNGTYSRYSLTGGYVNAPMPRPILVKPGDTLGVAFDLINNRISFYVNNVHSGTLAVAPGKVWSPFTYASHNSNYTAKAYFGAQGLRYPVPAGYQQIDSFVWPTAGLESTIDESAFAHDEDDDGGNDDGGNDDDATGADITGGCVAGSGHVGVLFVLGLVGVGRRRRRSDRGSTHARGT